MLSYPSAIPLSSRTLNHLADLIRAARASAAAGGGASTPAGRPCSPWPTCATATPITRLACGFAISVTTAWRYVREAIDLLATHAET